MSPHYPGAPVALFGAVKKLSGLTETLIPTGIIGTPIGLMY